MNENLETRTTRESTDTTFLSYPTEQELRPTPEMRAHINNLFLWGHYSSRSGEDYFMLAHEHTKKGCDCFYHGGAD